jgi:succinate-acetate transporter protein
MADVVLLLLALVFLALTAAYVRGCEAIVRSGQSDGLVPAETAATTADEGAR